MNASNPPKTAAEHKAMAADIREMVATYPVSTSAREAALRVADEHDQIAASLDALAVEIVADNTLLNQIGSATPGAAGMLADDDLSAQLLAWRLDIETPDIPDLVDTDTAIATIRGAA